MTPERRPHFSGHNKELILKLEDMTLKAAAKFIVRATETPLSYDIEESAREGIEIDTEAFQNDFLELVFAADALAQADRNTDGPKEAIWAPVARWAMKRAARESDESGGYENTQAFSDYTLKSNMPDPIYSAYKEMEARLRFRVPSNKDSSAYPHLVASGWVVIDHSLAPELLDVSAPEPFDPTQEKSA